MHFTHEFKYVGKLPVVTVHSASLSRGKHVLSQGIYVVCIGWYRFISGYALTYIVGLNTFNRNDNTLIV